MRLSCFPLLCSLLSGWAWGAADAPVGPGTAEPPAAGPAEAA